MQLLNDKFGDMMRDMIIEAVRNHFGDVPTKVIQDELSKLLKVSPATVYNKLSGRNDFSNEEFLLIAGTYNISVDNIIFRNNRDCYHFFTDSRNTKPRDFEEYLLILMQNVNQAGADKDSSIYFICLQPHIFHLMKYPYLLYTKLYTFNLINWKNQQMMQFDPGKFIQSENYRHLTQRLYQAYACLPATEILNQHFIHPLCSQIEYLIDSQIIASQEDIHSIRKELYLLTDELEQTAARGGREVSKHGFTPIDMFVNKFIHISNIVLVQSASKSFFTLQCEVPDVLKTTDFVFISHFTEWLEKNQEYAVPISKTGGLERKRFFNGMRRQIDETFH